MSEETLPSIEECIEEIRTKPVVSPWPTVGVAFELSKGGTYDAMRRGDFETMRKFAEPICYVEKRFMRPRRGPHLCRMYAGRGPMSGRQSKRGTA